MQILALTPFEFESRYAAKVKSNQTPVRKRHSLIYCYAPSGTGRPSQRITGNHLAPDSEEMLHASLQLSGALQQAYLGGTGSLRVLVNPTRYSDRILTRYCRLMEKTAFGPPNTMLISPALVPYLLGGMTTKAVEELAHRALDLLDYFPEPLNPKQSMQRALSVVGFGGHIAHIYAPEQDPAKKKYANLSHRQEFLLNLPNRGTSFAATLIDRGAFEDSLHRLVRSYQDDILKEVEQLLDPEGGEMTEKAQKGRSAVEVTTYMYRMAVRRVFEKPWADLDLRAQPDTAHEDAVVLMARKVIQRLAYNDKMSAESLVGISLLTGISLANWTAFAVEDQRRRGETFITAEEIERAIDMVGISPHFKCEQQLRGDATAIRFFPGGLAKWARRLQSPNRPLWSSNGDFYITGLRPNGIATYKHKPFSLLSE